MSESHERWSNTLELQLRSAATGGACRSGHGDALFVEVKRASQCRVDVCAAVLQFHYFHPDKPAGKIRGCYERIEY